MNILVIQVESSDPEKARTVGAYLDRELAIDKVLYEMDKDSYLIKGEGLDVREFPTLKRALETGHFIEVIRTYPDGITGLETNVYLKYSIIETTLTVGVT